MKRVTAVTLGCWMALVGCSGNTGDEGTSSSSSSGTASSSGQQASSQVNSSSQANNSSAVNNSSAPASSSSTTGGTSNATSVAGSTSAPGSSVAGTSSPGSSVGGGSSSTGGVSSSGPAQGTLGGACYPNLTCNTGLTCDNAVCISATSGSSSSSGGIPDGNLGGRCYGNGTCNAMLRCNGVTCEAAPTGSEGGACYGNGTCDFGLRCSNNVCEPLFNSSSSSSGGGGSSSSGGGPAQGSEGGACYPNSTCNLGLDCNAGTCVGRTQGSLNGPCYGNGTCNSGLVCTNNTCLAPPQGTEGGACFPNNTCNSGLSCINGLCATPPPDAGSGGMDAGMPSVPAPAFLGDSCDPNFHQASCAALASGAQCLALTSGGGVCLKPNCNATAPCPNGNNCLDLGTTDYCAQNCNVLENDGGVAVQPCGAGQACVNFNDGITGTLTHGCFPLAAAGCRYDQTPTGCDPGFECTPVGTDGYGECFSALTLGGSCEPQNPAACQAVANGVDCITFQGTPDVGWCVSMNCTAGQQCQGPGSVCVAAGTNTFCSSSCDGAGQCGINGACVGWGGGVNACLSLGFASCRTDQVPSGCQATEGCVATGTDGYGDCFPACDAFQANSCLVGNGCYPISATGGVCLTAGTVPAGQACTYSDECAPGLGCSLITATCRTLCDAQHPCPGGTGACQYNLFAPTIGVCE